MGEAQHSNLVAQLKILYHNPAGATCTRSTIYHRICVLVVLSYPFHQQLLHCTVFQFVCGGVVRPDQGRATPRFLYGKGYALSLLFFLYVFRPHRPNFGPYSANSGSERVALLIL